MKKQKNKSSVKIKMGSFQEAPYTQITDPQTGKPKWNLDLPPIEPESLPTVSVVTITKDRAHMAAIMLYNWKQTRYPENKIEWVIVDDSNTDILRQYLPLSEDSRIHYYHTDYFDNIAEKRNYACSLTKNEYIAFMDDDDYYFPDHILVKAQILLVSNRKGIHSMPLAVYDAITKESWIFDWTKKGRKVSNGIAEASVMMKRSYWELHPFHSTANRGISEGASIVGRRFYDWINVHFLFNMISITHKKNITNDSRRLNLDHDKTKVGSFRDVFPESFLYIIDNMQYE
jgi:glycosyltransferase involved in cell wall biosynthesis